MILKNPLEVLIIVNGIYYSKITTNHKKSNQSG